MSVRVCLCLCVSVPVSPSQLPNARAVSIYLTFKTHAMFDLAHLCGQDWHPKDHISFHPNLKKDILHESETRAVSEIGVMSEVCERDVWHVHLPYFRCVCPCVCVCVSVCLSVCPSVCRPLNLSTSRPLCCFPVLGPILDHFFRFLFLVDWFTPGDFEGWHKTDHVACALCSRQQGSLLAG